MPSRAADRTIPAGSGDSRATEILRRRAETLAQPIPEAAVDIGIPVLAFRRGGRLAIDVEQVREVGPVHRIEPLPEQPPFVAGLVAWRGRPIVAIDPAALLSVSPPDAPAHQIVVGLSGGEVALLADEIRGVLSVRRDALGKSLGGPASIDRVSVGFHESIGLLIDAGLLEANLVDQSQQQPEVRP